MPKNLTKRDLKKKLKNLSTLTPKFIDLDKWFEYTAMMMFAERRSALSVQIGEFKNHKKDVKKKILLSAGLGAAMVGVAWGGIPLLALKEGASAAKFLPDLQSDGLTLGLSYGVQIVSSFINLNQERRLLENPNIGMSQGFGSTVAYYGLEKVKPLKEKRHRSIAAVVMPTVISLGWTIPREMAFVSLALLSQDKMQELTLLKSAQAIFSLSQAGAAEVALRTLGREKDKKQFLPANGLVFESTESAVK